jgi:toxin secretion/phage lysis holin
VVSELIFLYIVPFVLICFDFLTGFIKAIYSKKLDSTILRKGLFHKLAELLALIGCGGIDYGVKFVNLPFDFPILPSVAIYICIMEIISCFENLCAVNPALNNFFAPYLQKLKNETEDKENDIRD